MSPPRVVVLDPAAYRRTPWKNGGGVTIDIADAYRPCAVPGAWEGMIWRFGRTGFGGPRAPFSDLGGHDRIFAVVVGRGVVLETPDGEIDVRAPFHPVRFCGETPVTARLEAGPVEVVNLIGDRSAVALDLTFLEPGGARSVGAGCHVVYAPTGPASVVVAHQRLALPIDHAIRIEAADDAALRCEAGRVVVASITSCR